MSFTMHPKRPLPARAVPLNGESLVSLVRRTSQAMGYEKPGRIRGLLAGVGETPTHLNLLAPGPPSNRLAELLRVCPADLQAMTFHHFAAQLVLSRREGPTPTSCDSKTLLRYFRTAASPICPRCLLDDPVPFERLVWSLRPLPMCPIHQCLLVSHCPACQRAFRHTRHDAAHCACGHVISTISVSDASSSASDLVSNMEQVLLKRTELGPGMSVAATFWWAERLASAASKTPVWLKAVVERLNIDIGPNHGPLAWLAAAEILADWPKCLAEFLGEFQQVTKHGTTSTGISRRFGLLLREAAHLEQVGYAVPADALRDYLLRDYSAGHLNGKVCLFQDPASESRLANRPWMTQTEAAKQLRIRSGAIGPLIARNVLVGHVHSAGQRDRSLGLVSRKSVDSLRRELDNSLSVCEAVKRLGIGRHAVLDFIRDDLLPRAVRTAAGWKIPARSVEDLETLCDSVPPIDVASREWLSLRQATCIGGPSGLAMSSILKRIQAGSIAARMADRSLGLNGMVVSRAALANAQEELREECDPSSDWSLHRAAQNLFADQSMKPRILKKWIALGLLQTVKKGRRAVISANEIRRFRANYCLAREAIELLGISRSTLSRWEVQGCVVPVYGKRVTPGAGVSLYCRADLQRLLNTRS